MLKRDKPNGLFQSALGVCLSGFYVYLLALFSLAWPAAAQQPAPVDTAAELSDLDIAGELSSRIPAAQMNALNWLRTGGDPDTVIDADGNTVMHYAAANPYLDILREAVRRGGHCNRQNTYGATPLHFAASKGGENMEAAAQAVRILARCEATPDVSRTCASAGRTEDECRADPNAQDRRGGTPLHTLYEGLESERGLAGWGGGANAASQQALLEVGADPDVKNRAGDTPLMLALRYNGVMFTKPGHVLQLLKHDADPDTRNKRSITPLTETVSLFSSINAKDDPARVIVALLRYGADPDLRAGNSDTPLIRAARHEDDSVYEIEALLAGGADPCLRDRSGRLAYDYAGDGSSGQQALYDAGGYPERETGVCVRGLHKAEAREQQLGMDQDTRQRIQSCLKTAGFDPGAQDGQFVPGTRAAVRAWQQAQGREGIEAAGYFAEGEADVLLETCRDVAPEQTALERQYAGEKEEITAVTTEPKCLVEYSERRERDVIRNGMNENEKGCWFKISNKNECYTYYEWNDDGGRVSREGSDSDVLIDGQGHINLGISWSGECSNGVATGKGTLKWLADYECKGEFVNGKRYGEWTCDDNPYSTSDLTIINYKNGIMDGLYKIQWDGGGVIVENIRNYQNGQRHGLSEGFIDGRLFWRENYQNGNEISSESFPD